MQDRFCSAELPVLGHMAECLLPDGHTGCHRSRLHIERTRGRRSSSRWYGVTWGPAQPIELEPSPSIRLPVTP